MTTSPEGEILAQLLAEAADFRNQMGEESDRGCALMAAARLSDQLEMLLRTAFVDDDAVAAPLFDGPRPLGSFSARIDLAYLFGLLPLQARRDLHLIRRIRNDFGHVAGPMTFSTPEVAARCAELYHSASAQPASERALFVHTVMAVWGVIDAQVMSCGRSTRPRDVVIDEAYRRQLHAVASVARDRAANGTDSVDAWRAIVDEAVLAYEREHVAETDA